MNSQIVQINRLLFRCEKLEKAIKKSSSVNSTNFFREFFISKHFLQIYQLYINR